MKAGGIVLGVICLLVLAASAQAKLLASGVDEGDRPRAHARASIADPNGPLQLEVRGHPYLALEADVSINCSRGSLSKAKDWDLPPQAGSILKRLPLTIGNPDHCAVAIAASYVDFDDSGRITAKLFGHTDH